MDRLIKIGKPIRSIKELKEEKTTIKRELNEIETETVNNILNPQYLLIDAGLSAVSGLVGSFNKIKDERKNGIMPMITTTIKLAGKVIPLKTLSRLWVKAQLFNTAVFVGKKTGEAIKKKVKKAP